MASYTYYCVLVILLTHAEHENRTFYNTETGRRAGPNERARSLLPTFLSLSSKRGRHSARRSPLSLSLSLSRLYNHGFGVQAGGQSERASERANAVAVVRPSPSPPPSSPSKAYTVSRDQRVRASEREGESQLLNQRCGSRRPSVVAVVTSMRQPRKRAS